MSWQENMPMDSELKIPDTLDGYPVAQIGDSAFENIRLKSVAIPGSVEINGEGAGIGEYIVYDQIVFSGSLIESNGNNIRRTGSYWADGYIDYTQICIVNGYARDEKVWQENGRVKTLMMYVYDQPYARLQLEDTINPQYFTLPEGDIRVPNGGKVTFKFVIEEVYPGTLYEDACITGIAADFGNVPDGH